MPQFEYIDIGKRLREFGEKNFVSMVVFSKALKMSATNLNQYLVGRNMPGGKLLIRLAELGCDITWLLTGAKYNESIIMNQVAVRMIELEKELKEKNKKLSKIRDEIDNGDKKPYHSNAAEPKTSYNKKED